MLFFFEAVSDEGFAEMQITNHKLQQTASVEIAKKFKDKGEHGQPLRKTVVATPQRF